MARYISITETILRRLSMHIKALCSASRLDLTVSAFQRLTCLKLLSSACVSTGDFLFVHLYELLTVFFDTTVIATGGKDGKVRFWDHSLKSTKEINVTELAQEIQDEMGRKLCFFSGKTIYIKSIALGEFEKDEPGKMVIGTKDNEIYEIDLTSEKPKLKIIVQGHSQGAGSTKLGEWGELWGLQPSSNKNIFVSAGDDRTMRLWDMETRSILAVRRLEEQARYY